jgi:hypothetical protein
MQARPLSPLPGQRPAHTLLGANLVRRLFRALDSQVPHNFIARTGDRSIHLLL